MDESRPPAWCFAWTGTHRRSHCPGFAQSSPTAMPTTQSRNEEGYRSRLRISPGTAPHKAVTALNFLSVRPLWRVATALASGAVAMLTRS
jgi:hypothetical protein